MLQPARGLTRAVRAAALAAVVLGISAVAHVAGGGGLPGPGPLAALALPVLLACLLLTRQRLTTIRSAAVMGTGQLVLHHAFMAVSPTQMGSSAASMHAVATPLAMLVAHTGATIVLAAAFSAGDGSLWRLWAWLAPLHVLGLLAPPAPVLRRPLAVAVVDPPALQAVRQHAVGRRGPPVALVG